MNLKEAISTLICAANVRREQWAGLSEGSDPSDLVDELYEADHQEATYMARGISQAIDIVKEANIS